MAYEKTKAKAAELDLTADDIYDIIRTYADEMAEAEPHATISIKAAVDTAYGIESTLNED